MDDHDASVGAALLWTLEQGLPTGRQSWRNVSGGLRDAQQRDARGGAEALAQAV